MSNNGSGKQKDWVICFLMMPTMKKPSKLISKNIWFI